MEMGSVVLATSKSRIEEQLPQNFGKEFEIFPLSAHPTLPTSLIVISHLMALQKRRRLWQWLLQKGR
jgi:hypothetical protein